MAELDYAFLADYAQIEGGKLSTLGASYTHGSVGAKDSQWLTSVAGRVRTSVDDPPVELSIRIVGPDGAYELHYGSQLEIGPEARPYGEGKVGILFVNTFTLPILAGGTYQVFLDLDGKQVRRLAFDLSVAQ